MLYYPSEFNGVFYADLCEEDRKRADELIARGCLVRRLEQWAMDYNSSRFARPIDFTKLFDTGVEETKKCS